MYGGGHCDDCLWFDDAAFIHAKFPALSSSIAFTLPVEMPIQRKEQVTY